MITITPEMTVEQLCSLSENIKSAIISMTFDLKSITDAITTKNVNHEAAVENLKNRHAAELAALEDDFEDTTELVEKNTAFINAIGQFLGE